jgi:hypothetical protein
VKRVEKHNCVRIDALFEQESAVDDLATQKRMKSILAGVVLISSAFSLVSSGEILVTAAAWRKQ